MARRIAHPASPDEWSFAPCPKWVRARRGGRTIADSRRVLFVWEPGVPYPWYAFPSEDVAEGGTPLEDPELQGHLLLRFSDADEWLEEDEVVLAHPHDPFHRIDVRRSSRRVRVELDGEELADSRRPVLLFETGLPVRTYFPPGDVRMDRLGPSPTVTACAYKGHATHFSAGRAGDVAWTYETVLPDGPAIAGLVAFYDEHVDVFVDGELQERPATRWSRRRRA